VGAAQFSVPTITVESFKTSPAGTTTTESLQPISNPLESLLGEGSAGWANGNPNRDLYKLNFEWGAVEGLTARRNFAQNRVAVAGQAFGTGVQAQLDESLSLAPLTGTALSFSHQRVGLTNLASVQLSGTDVTNTAFTQSFGRGSSTGAFSLTRKVAETYGRSTNARSSSALAALQSVTEENYGLSQNFTSGLGAGKIEMSRGMVSTAKPNELTTSTTTEGLKLSSALGARMNLTGGYQSSSTNVPGGTDTTVRNLSVTRALGAGTASMGFTNTIQQVNGLTTETTSQSYRLPAMAQGAALSLGYDRTQVAQNGRGASDTQAYSLSAARQIDGRNYTGSYSRSLTDAGGVDTETTVQSLTAPLSVRGTGVALAFNSSTTQQNRLVVSDSRAYSLSTQLNRQALAGNWSRTQALANGVLTENTVQGFSAPLSIMGTGLALAFNSNTTQQNGRVVGDNRSYTAATRLNNQDVKGSWSRTQALADGVFTENTVQGLNAPLSIRGTGLALAFNSNTTQANQRVVADNRSLSAVTRLNNQDVVANWGRVGVTADNAYTETTTAKYQAPLRLLGTPLAVGFTSSTVQVNQALVSDVRALNLASRLNNQDIAGGWSRNTALTNGVYVETKTQTGALPLRMLGNAVAVSFNSTTVQNNGVEAADNRSINVATRLGGENLAASWARALNPVNGTAQKVTTGRFTLPVSFFGEKLNLAYNLDALHVNNVLQSATRTVSAAVPLARFLPGANYTLAASSYRAAGQTHQQWLTQNLTTPISIGGKGYTTDHMYRQITSAAGDGHQWVTNASGPISLLGRTVSASGQYAEALQPDDSGSQRLATDLSVPFKPGALTISRVRATTIASGGASSSTTATTNIAGPRVPLNARASMQANVSLLDQPSGDQRTTHLNLQAKPANPLTVEADYTLSEFEKRRSLAQHQLTASYALSQRLSLNTRYLEKEQLDQSPLIQRQVVLQRKAASGQDLSLRAALANVDSAAAEGDLLRLVELGFGDARAVALSMQYQEYNEADLAVLAAPTVKVSLQHGTDSTLNWLFNYQDAAGRLEPLRQYGVGIPVGGGGRLKVSLTQNPLDTADATGATIKRMDMYDASLSGKLLGDVGMSVAYRCYDSTAHANLYARDLDQYVQLQLSGGSAEGHGQVQISYANGEFVPANATNVAWTPKSTLTVKYEKKWSDVGSLSLNLNRTNVPEGYAEVSDTYEGRLQFEYKF